MKIAKSWNSVSIAQFQQLQKLKEPTYENQLITISILTGMELEQVEDLPTATIEKLLAGLDWMNTLPEPKQVKQFRHGNSIYRFAASRHDITAGQFITVQDLFSGEDWISQLHNIMAALTVRYRILPPKRFEIKAKDYEYTADMFRREMPISVAYAYALFFSAYYPQLQRISQAYLEGVKRAAEEYANGQG